MGQVLLARDETLERDVAIKELDQPIGSDGGAAARRTLREARAAARINHPNVVQVYDVLQLDDRTWIVMEYVPCRSLREEIAERGPLDPYRVARIGLDLIGALRTAHRLGVEHRDVKPANVLLADDGRVLLTDFGIAAVDDDGVISRSDILVGSPQFMAPERAQHGTSGPEADLWSLGATLYAAIEGRAPYQRGSTMATLTALTTEEPDPPRHTGALRPLLDGLLRKDPTTRMTSEDAESLARTILDGLSDSGETPPPVKSGGALAGLAAVFRIPRQRSTSGSGAVSAREEGESGSASAKPVTEQPAAAGDAENHGTAGSAGGRSDANPGADGRNTVDQGSASRGAAAGPAVASAATGAAGAEIVDREPAANDAAVQDDAGSDQGRGVTEPDTDGRTDGPEAGGPSSNADRPDAAGRDAAGRDAAGRAAAGRDAAGRAAAGRAAGGSGVAGTGPVESGTEGSNVGGPGADGADAGRADTEGAGADEPGADEPGADEPGIEEPGVEEPGADEPGVGGRDGDGRDIGGRGEPGEASAGPETGSAVRQDVAEDAGTALTATRIDVDSAPSVSRDIDPAADPGGERGGGLTAVGVGVVPGPRRAGGVWGPPGGVSGEGAAVGSGRPRRGVLVAAAVLAVVLAAGTVWAVRAGSGDGAPEAGPKPAATAGASAAVSAGTGGDPASAGPDALQGAQPGASGADPGASGAGTIPGESPVAGAEPSAEPSEEPDGGRPELPDGWREYKDKTGFAVYVPEGWTRSQDRTMVYFRGDNKVLGIDQTDKPKSNPVKDWRGQADYRTSRGDFPGYKEIKIESVDYFRKAADWEFTFNRNGSRRHVNNRGTVVADDKAYGFWWETSDSAWDDSRDDLQLVFDSFVPAR